MPPVLDENGLTIQSLAEIRSEMDANFRSKFTAGMTLDPDSPEGLIIGVISEQSADIQQLAQAIYDAFDPASASGVSLERIAAYTAITRNAATPSTATLYLAGTSGTVIPLGALVEAPATGDQFQTLSPVTLGSIGNITLATGSSLSISGITRSGTVATATTAAPHGLPNGAVVTISGVTGGDASLYNVTAEIENVGASTFDYNMAGTPGGSSAGTEVYQDEGLASDHITLSTAVARAVAHGLSTGEFVFVSAATEDEYNGLFLVTVLDVDHFEYTETITTTPATGSFTADETTPVEAESVEAGPIPGPSSAITEIVNAISGWTRVENFLAATLGNNVETDAELRARRIATLLGLGNSTLGAIRGDMLTVADVTQALIFENDEIVVVDGRPAKSVEAVVVDGDDQEIADALFETKAGGIETFGTEGPFTHVDSQGDDHDVRFSRPTKKDIWLEIDFAVDGTFPSDGLTQAEDAVLVFGALLNIGDDVIIFPQLVGALDGISGILDLVIRIAATAEGAGDPSPTLDNNITIGETEISNWDRTRLTFV